MNVSLSRLVYLAAEYSQKIPSRVTRWVPQGELINMVGTYGLRGAATELGVDLEQLKKLYLSGKKGDPGSKEEFKTLIVSAAIEEIELQEEDLPLSQRVREISHLQRYLETGDDLLDGVKDAPMNKSMEDEQDLIKWNSGLTPLDLVTGGLYQGLVMLIAQPGTGKTSLMLTLMEELRKNDVASSIWFYETEIPLPLMLYRTKAMRQRTTFLEQDRMISGVVPITDIIQACAEDPDPNRIIFYDSPDVLAGGTPDSRRFVLESIFRDLVILKNHAKAVFVTSQPRRNDKTISMQSGAEAWSKAWYADLIFGAWKNGYYQGGGTKLRLRVVKNRFGTSDQEILMKYHYPDCSWEETGDTPMDPGEWEDSPRRGGDDMGGGEDW